MRKLIIVLVCGFVLYAAHALELNKDCDGRVCNTDYTAQRLQ